MENRLVDTAAGASHLGLAKSTLEKMRVRGDGPPFVKLGRAVRYRLIDLDGWAAAHIVGSTSELAA